MLHLLTDIYLSNGQQDQFDEDGKFDALSDEKDSDNDEGNIYDLMIPTTY